jgi:hypothetical protein
MEAAVASVEAEGVPAERAAGGGVVDARAAGGTPFGVPQGVPPRRARERATSPHSRPVTRGCAVDPEHVTGQYRTFASYVSAAGTIINPDQLPTRVP